MDSGVNDPGYRGLKIHADEDFYHHPPWITLIRLKHLTRLQRVYSPLPLVFVTTCTAARKPVLADAAVAAVCREEWLHAKQRHGWTLGTYVIMPDHAHFFCVATADAKPLSTFVGKWKEWTAKRLQREHALPSPLWQPEFFDRVLRRDEDYAAKIEYMRQNPVRAGLVHAAEHWPWQGMIFDLTQPTL